MHIIKTIKKFLILIFMNGYLLDQISHTILFQLIIIDLFLGLLITLLFILLF